MLQFSEKNVLEETKGWVQACWGGGGVQEPEYDIKQSQNVESL